MTLKFTHTKVLLILTTLLFFNSNILFAQSSQKDSVKRDLARFILTEFLNDPEDKDQIYLLTNNLLSAQIIENINKDRKAKIKLVEKPVLGEDVYFFESFWVKGNSAKIKFGKNWRSLSGIGFSETIFHYQCRKKKGKWDCKVISVRMGQS